MAFFKNKKLEELKKQEEEKQKLNKEKRLQTKNSYYKELRLYGHSDNDTLTTHTRKNTWFTFRYKNGIRFFVWPPEDWTVKDINNHEWEKFDIDVEEIQYFSREGEVYTETKVTGGGGGSNIGDAIIGGLIAGAPGAIIASRGKSDPIKSETIKHDSRKTVLVTNKGTLNFAPEDYNAFMQLIPEKELSVVQHVKAIKSVSKSRPESLSIETRLRKLQELKEKKLISEEEYSTKKAQILAEL